MNYAVWIGFLVFVALMVALDLGVFHRRAHRVAAKEALTWTFIWIALALAFNVLVYFLYQDGWAGGGQESAGAAAAAQFFTGYVLEKSLSIDNVFVIAMIFGYFGIPPSRQHRLLFWGILGAVVLRGALILLGAALLERFEWITYLLGGLLLATSVKMLLAKHESIDFDQSIALRLLRRLYPVCADYDGHKFFTVQNGRRAATPMLLALVLVETSDVVFAVDSIPAVFAVTRDPFLVFTSNVFAILGLRSLYFVLAAAIDRFQYVKLSLVFVLAFVGVKMLLAHHYPISNFASLAVVSSLLALGILASLRGAPLAMLRSSKSVRQFARLTYRQARRVVVLVIGGTVLLIGAAMIVLPGPAFVVMPLGLAILALEFAWARRWLRRLQQGAGKVFGPQKKIQP